MPGSKRQSDIYKNKKAQVPGSSLHRIYAFIFREIIRAHD